MKVHDFEDKELVAAHGIDQRGEHPCKRHERTAEQVADLRAPRQAVEKRHPEPRGGSCRSHEPGQALKHEEAAEDRGDESKW